MSALTRFARLLSLVPFLQTHQGILISSAAESMGVTERELLADLNLLWVCGLPGYTHAELIDLEFENGRISITNADTLAKPLSLTSEEAIALSLGLSMLAALPNASLYEDLRSAQTKIQATALRASELAELSRQVVVIPEVPTAEVSAHLQTLEAAIAQKRQVQIDYYVSSRDEMTTRVIEPHRLRLIDGVSYLDAWCLVAQAPRIFRLDRILGAGLLDASHSHSSEDFPEFDQRASLSEYEISLAPTGRWILERYGAKILKDDQISDVVATIAVGDRNWLLRLALSAGGDLKVTSDADLEDDIGYLARLALANYEGE